jgi:hypothetical protein
LKEYPECEIVIWMPVVEQDFGQERFFFEQPVELFGKGTFNKLLLLLEELQMNSSAQFQVKKTQFFVANFD